MKEKWQEYKKKDGVVKEMGNLGWTRNALFALVSDRAGECEDIPPAEWDTPLAVSGVSQVCQKKMERYSGGITGEKVSVAKVIASEFYDHFGALRMSPDWFPWMPQGNLPDLLWGDELLCCRHPPSVDVSHSINHSIQNIALESACWPNENPISGDRGNYLRLTMKGPLLCEKKTVVADGYYYGFESICKTGSMHQHLGPFEFTKNATIVMDVPICILDLDAEWSDDTVWYSSARIVDPPPSNISDRSASWKSRPSFGPSFEATLVGIDEDHQAQLDEHIAALEEEFNTPSEFHSFNPQGLEPSPEEVFVPDESWPKTSFMVKNWPADDPLGCK